MFCVQEVRVKLAALDEADGPAPVMKPCSLDKPTQALIKLIFDNDMFREAMKSLEIGTCCNFTGYTTVTVLIILVLLL